MPRIIDYSQVIDRAIGKLGLVSAYYNSGAFTYPRGEAVEIVGWIGPDDPTIHEALRPSIARITAPYEANLASSLERVWGDHIHGEAWVLPKAHWSFELEHGHGGWMRSALQDVGVDPASLEGLTNAPAIAFDRVEQGAFVRFVTSLLTCLVNSDFAVIFPDHRHLVTLHHHKQVWWQTPDAPFAQMLRSCL